MSHRLAYLNVNRDNIREQECGPLVTADDVCLGRRVQWGKHWSKKWRDNIGDTKEQVPSGYTKERVAGTIIGYVDETGLVGENSNREYNQVQQGQKDWCVVRWDNGKQSVYPIGAQGLYSLSYLNE